MPLSVCLWQMRNEGLDARKTFQDESGWPGITPKNLEGWLWYGAKLMVLSGSELLVPPNITC